MLVVKLICKKCGYSKEIEHFGELNGDELNSFIKHLVKCDVVSEEIIKG